MTKAYPDIAITGNEKERFEDAEINGIIIAAPAVAHYNLALTALHAGKHVFVEKPLSLNQAMVKNWFNWLRKEKRPLCRPYSALPCCRY